MKEHNYLLICPKNPEGLENFPSPRTWTMLARLLYYGMNDEETIKGLIGNEAGLRFITFIETNVNIEDIINEPKLFETLTLDGKYMCTFLLGTWCEKNMEELNKAFPLIDKISTISREYLALLCLNMKRDKLAKFVMKLLQHDRKYESILSEITNIKACILK